MTLNLPITTLLLQSWTLWWRNCVRWYSSATSFCIFFFYNNSIVLKKSACLLLLIIIIIIVVIIKISSFKVQQQQNHHSNNNDERQYLLPCRLPFLPMTTKAVTLCPQWRKSIFICTKNIFTSRTRRIFVCIMKETFYHALSQQNEPITITNNNNNCYRTKIDHSPNKNSHPWKDPKSNIHRII